MKIFRVLNPSEDHGSEFKLTVGVFPLNLFPKAGTKIKHHSLGSSEGSGADIIKRRKVTPNNKVYFKLGLGDSDN
jgi:hypothetical protein